MCLLPGKIFSFLFYDYDVCITCSADNCCPSHDNKTHHDVVNYGRFQEENYKQIVSTYSDLKQIRKEKKKRKENSRNGKLFFMISLTLQLDWNKSFCDVEQSQATKATCNRLASCSWIQQQQRGKRKNFPDIFIIQLQISFIEIYSQRKIQWNGNWQRERQKIYRKKLMRTLKRLKHELKVFLLEKKISEKSIS